MGRVRIRVGIDTGKSGAMAIIITMKDDWRSVIETIPFDKDEYVCALASTKAAFSHGLYEGDIKCALERVHAMPKQGVSSTFSFGENFGWIQGVLSALQIPYELVEPKKWKKEFGVTADKNTSIAVAQRLFPNTSLKRTDKCKKDDDGVAEALLIAEYARRRM